MTKTYTRTELTETTRRLAQGRTWYARLVEKNRKAEAAYQEKLAQLEAQVAELQK
jgi:hypothetical protein